MLTQSFYCALIAYNKERNRIEVVSRGSFSEKVSVERKEPPYPAFLSEDNSFIALMLFENIIKIIPLVHNAESGFRLQMSNAVNIRVRHSDVTTIVPLYRESQKDDPTFGILY